MSYNLSKIKKFTNQKTQFVSFTCTDKYIYIATKKQIFRLSATNITEKSATAELPISGQNILHIYHIYINPENTLILLQTDGNIFVLKEKSFGRDKWTVVDLKFNYNKYVHFSALKQDSLSVFVDSQNLYLYSFNINQLTNDITWNLKKAIQHRMRDPIDVLATADTILVYDKKCYRIFNSKLDELSHQQVSKTFRCVTPIIGYNSYCAIQDNTLIQIYDERKLFHQEIKFTDAIISLQVKLPYICAISQKNFFYYLTVSDGEPNVFPLPKDMKTKPPALMCIRDNVKDKTKDKAKVNSNYNVFYASDDTLYSIEYNDDHDHKYLTSNGKWDQLVEMYVLMDHDLESFYKSMADDMLTQRQYEKAFEAFKKSRCNPFEVLGRFHFLKCRAIYDEASRDAKERSDLLNALSDLISNGIPDQSKIQTAINNVNKQSHMKSNLITENNIDRKQIANLISETNEVKTEINGLTKNGIKKIEEQSDYSNQLYSALRNYVEGLISYEQDPTRLKIYNTILCKIYIKSSMILPMQSLIENKNPVFFSILFTELKKITATQVILSLCEQYHQHEIAINTAKEDNSYDLLISYVSNSSDCLTLAPGLLKEVFLFYCEDKDKKKMPPAAAAKKAAGLFFSHDLYKTPEDVENVLKIIDSIDLNIGSNPRNYKDDVKEAFLNFVVFTLHSESRVVNSQLCDLYINKLLNLIDPSMRTKYIDITQEKEEMKQPREALLKLLMESDYYEPSDVVQKLPDIYLEEKIAAYLKINTKGSLEKCIDLVVVPNVDIEIAVTKFCDIAYDKDDIDRSDIYNLLFNALNQEYNKNKNSPDLRNRYMKRIKYLLNERAKFLNPDQVIENIPKDIPIIELKDFFDNSSTPRINRLRQLKLQNALIEETIKQKQTQIQYLKAGKVVVTRGLKCIVCGKSIDESVFYVRNDSTVAHAACNASHDD
ncbi:Vam6/Vps39-like protein [Tritrichomonas musculus]|uniref:Vam6/Vps39-like protein n=1 Tax=Tritrichomonas musculus TaxID=1915356 RepID=A0ABR2J112_9EUKA